MAACARAQTPEDDIPPPPPPPVQDFQVVPEVNGPPSDVEITAWPKPAGYVSCEIIDDIEYCTTGGMAYNFVFVPADVAPFMAELVTTERFATTDRLKSLYPDRELWELRHACGAALISPRWAVTAAHCFGGDTAPEKYAVRLGLKSLSEPAAVTAEVERIELSRTWNPGTLENDIALIKLKPYQTDLKIISQSDLDEHRELLSYIPEAGVMPGGQHLWSLGGEPGLRIWSVEQGAQTHHISDFPQASPTALDETFLVWKTPSGLRRLNVLTGQQDTLLSGEILGLELSKDHQTLIVWGRMTDGEPGSEPYQLTAWDVDANRIIRQTPAAFVPAGAELLTPGPVILYDNDTRVHIWDLESGQLGTTDMGVLRIPYGFSERPVRLQRSEQLISAWGIDLIVANATTGETEQILSTPERYRPVFPSPAPPSTYLVGVSPDEKYAYTRNPGSRMLVWDLDAGNLDGVLKLDNAGQTAIYSPQSGLFVTEGYGGELKIYDPARQKRLHKVPGRAGFSAGEFRFFDQGRQIFQWSYQGFSRIINAQTGRQVRMINHSLPISSAELSDDGRTLIVTGEYGVAEIWDVQSGEPVVRVFHGRGLSGAQISADGRHVFSWGGRGEIKIWSAESGDLQWVMSHIDGQARRDDPPQDFISYVPVSHAPDDLLPNPMFGSAYLDVNVFGWGKTRSGPKFEPTSVMQWGEVRVLSKDACLQQGQWRSSSIDDNVFCAHSVQRKTCYGDSGGPVLRDIEAEALLVGIVSWGSGNCGDDDKPSVYTRVHKFSTWILETVCEDPDSASAEMCRAPTE